MTWCWRLLNVANVLVRASVFFWHMFLCTCCVYMFESVLCLHASFACVIACLLLHKCVYLCVYVCAKK